ncbi:MAG: LPP20 family lipoprotein, partial [Nitrospirota bacterium]
MFLCLGLMVSASTGCTWFTGKGKPGWVDGWSADYPSSQYLTGVGQADTRSNAEDQAYAAVARIFKAEVAAQAKDWESYWVVENHGVSNAERRLTIDSVTKVSTDKVLENVRIADVWYDSKSRVYYALSVMNRPQAEASLMEKVAALDRTIDTDVTESRQAIDKLAKVRALR